MQLLDKKQVCAKLAVKPTTLRNWVRAGRVPEPIRVGHVVRWVERDVDAAIAALTEL